MSKASYVRSSHIIDGDDDINTSNLKVSQQVESLHDQMNDASSIKVVPLPSIGPGQEEQNELESETKHTESQNSTTNMIQTRRLTLPGMEGHKQMAHYLNKIVVSQTLR